MSLINKMLQDLEKKDGSGVAQDNALSGLQAPVLETKKQRPMKKIIIVALILIALLLALFCYYKMRDVGGKVNSSLLAISMKKSLVQPNRGRAVMHESAAATLKSVTVKPGQGSATISFPLTQAVRYKIDHADNNKTLLITLFGTRVATKLSTIKANRWFQSFSIKQKKTDIVIVITLKSGVKLQQLHLVEEPETRPDVRLDATFMVFNRVGKMEQAQVPLTKSQQSMVSYQQALQFLEQQKLKQALTKLRQTLRFSPSYTPANKLLAIILLQRGDVGAANRAMLIGLKYAPTDMELVKLRARCLLKMDRVEQALNVMQQQTPLLVSDPAYYALMARLYQLQGDYNAAAKLYNQLITVQPAEGLWWLGLGLALESAGKDNAALQAYHRALKYSITLSPSVQSFIETKVVNMQR